jgi:hypothetical protein
VFGMLFTAAVQGHIDPKSVGALTKLGNLLIKTHQLAKQEYLSAYNDNWPNVVADSMIFHPNHGLANPEAFESLSQQLSYVPARPAANSHDRDPQEEETADEQVSEEQNRNTDEQYETKQPQNAKTTSPDTAQSSTPKNFSHAKADENSADILNLSPSELRKLIRQRYSKHRKKQRT